MKRIIIILIACFLFRNASAQTTFQFRYWFDEDYSSHTDSFSVNGIWQLSIGVSHLAEGFHTLCTQVKDTSGLWFYPHSYLFYRLPGTVSETTINYTCWFDQDYEHRRIGAFVSEHLLFDIDSLPTGFHTLNFQFGEGVNSNLKSYLFYKKPHAEIQITRYEYWFNDLDSLKRTVSIAPQDTVNFVALIQSDTFPIRSTSFHFNPNGGTPVVNAKNEIHFRYYNVEDRYASKAIPYIDITVADTIYADTLERDTTKTIPAPRNNGIHWFKLMAGVGDSLSFHTDRPCTLQLFAPSGEEVFSANGTDVLSWNGCHAWESGDYYLAVHDAEDTGTISVSYQWIYRYAVLTWNVHRVGNGGVSTITFNGNGYTNLDTVYLIKGTDTLPALYVARESNTTTSVFFNFENADTGMYFAIFEYVDESLYKPNVIMVENAIPIVLTSTCSFPSTYMRGSVVTYTFEITNTGNMAAYNVPLYIFIGTPSMDGISHIKVDGLFLQSIINDWDLDSLSNYEKKELIAWAERQGDGHHFYGIYSYDSITGDSMLMRFNYFPLTLAPYETRKINVNITAKDSVEVLLSLPDCIPITHESSGYPFNSHSLSLSELKNGAKQGSYCCVADKISCVLSSISDVADIFAIISALFGAATAETIFGFLAGEGAAATAAYASCVLGALSALNTAIELTYCHGEPTNTPLWRDYFGSVSQLKSLAGGITGCLVGKFKKLEILAKIIVNTNAAANTLMFTDIFSCWNSIERHPNCPPSPPPTGGTSIPQVPVDPNDIIGYTAESGSHAVGAKQIILPYMIEFENDTAFTTAHAHTVVVRDTLNGNVFDLESFSATAFTIGNEVSSISGGHSFTRTVDMRPTIDALAQVQLDYRIDTSFALATWTFTSLDPMTLMPTVADTLGFLAIGGTGEVDFTINRKANLPDSTLIDNRAWIVFDNEEPIVTSTWRNIIDNTPPISQIDSIAYHGDTAIVSIYATDNLSGVWRYNLYAMMDGDVLLPMAMNVPIDSAAIFTTPDEVIQFRSTVIDSAGNVEPLTITPLITTIYDTLTVTACDNYTWGDSIYTVSGEYTQSKTAMLRNAPDTVSTLFLTVNHSTIGTETATACDSYTWNGTNYTASTSNALYSTINALGCDSTVTLHLTINNSTTSIMTATACDSYTWHGTAYTASTTTPTYLTTNAVGCDSTVTLHLTINHSNTGTETITACDSYTWHGTTHAASTSTPTYLTTNSDGCDSTVTLHLTINHSTNGTETITACDSYTWYGTAYTASTTTPTYLTTNATGCDSTVTLHLTINHSNTGTETITACDSYTWHGTVYTSSINTPTYLTTNAAGCDSTVTLHLTINHSNTGTETITACDSYTWHGTVYTSSINTPTYLTTNAAGCDSTVTLHLTINHSNTGTETITACDSYTWHGTAYTASINTPTYLTTNAAGCDSTVTLHLTINHSTTAIETVTACDSYTWHDSTYTASTLNSQFSTLNSAGCDSTITLHLTINHSTTAIETVTACDSYTWHDSTYTASTLNSQFSTLNSVGCDSTVTLHLTINYSTRDTIVDSASGSYTWNGTTFTESGEYLYQGQTDAGCDSIIVLQLTITEVGIDIADSNSNITLFPNPTTGKVTIIADNVAKVEVFDPSGRVVAIFHDTNEIDIHNLPSGAYTLRITLSNGTAVKRVVKQ